MKPFFILFVTVAALMIPFSGKSQSPESFSVSGKVQFLNPAPYEHLNKIWIYKYNDSKNQVLDSVNINADGTWKISLPAGKPDFYAIDIEKWDRATVYSDGNAVINSRGYDTAKIKIKNPPYVFVEGTQADNFINLVEHLIYMNYQEMIAAGQEIYNAQKNKDTVWSGYLKEKNPYGQIDNNFKARLKVLIKAFKDKPEVLYALNMLNWEKNQNYIIAVLDNLEKKYPDDPNPKEFKNLMYQRIAQAQKLKPGSPVPDLELAGLKGEKQRLRQYTGKVLLVDFWASWCGPCRAAIPKLKNMYNQYHKKGFDIVSVSIDDSKPAWLKAVKEENMPWHQFLSPDKEVTMKTFLFSAIPTLYLIDSNGKILNSFTGLTEGAVNEITKALD